MPEQITNGSFVGDLFIVPDGWTWIDHCEGWGTACMVVPYEEDMPVNEENCTIMQNMEYGCYCEFGQVVDLTGVSLLTFFGSFDGYHRWDPETPWASIWIDDRRVWTSTWDDSIDEIWQWPLYEIDVSGWTGEHTVTFRVPAGNFMGLNHVSAISSDLPPAPVAAFTGFPVNGETPLIVLFTDESTNTPTSWLWDFGDGYFASEQHPFHTYSTPGVYDVSLHAYNAGGNDLELKHDYITATAPPPPPPTFKPVWSMQIGEL